MRTSRVSVGELLKAPIVSLAASHWSLPIVAVWPTESLSRVVGDSELEWSGVYHTGKAYSTLGTTMAMKRWRTKGAGRPNDGQVSLLIANRSCTPFWEAY